MQLKSFVALICTIIVLLIDFNESVPTKVVKPDKVKPETEAAHAEKKPVSLPGARGKWSNKLDSKSKKIFNDYKKHIAKKLQDVHKVPATFVPKPDRYSTQIVSGILYHFLVKVPANKYAHVTVNHRGWKKDVYGKVENVNVRPTLYDLNDKNI